MTTDSTTTNSNQKKATSGTPVANPTNSWFFYIVLAIVSLLALQVVAPFLGVVILAFLTAMMVHPVYTLYTRFFGKQARGATAITMLVALLTIVLPLVLFAQLTVGQIIQFSNDIRELSKEHTLTIDTVVSYGNGVLERFSLEEYQMTTQEAQVALNNTIVRSARVILDVIVRTGAHSPNLIAQLFIYLFLLYYFIPLQKRIPQMIAKISPLDDHIDHLLINKVLAMSHSMILGTLVIAILQSLVGGILLFAFGAPYVIFWIAIMIFLGIIPLVGPTTVLVPAGMLFIAFGQVWQGAFLIVFTLLVVSNLDNLLRPRLVSKEAELHPGFILVGVLGGLKAFGVLGVIYGPVIMILLVTLLQIFQQYFTKTQTQV